MGVASRKVSGWATSICLVSLPWDSVMCPPMETVVWRARSTTLGVFACCYSLVRPRRRPNPLYHRSLLRSCEHKLRTRFSFPFSMMALANAGSVLARRQRHNLFLFSRANISNDGCDYDVFLFISWECKRTGTFQSQV